MAKLFATEMAERVTRDGMQIHGGNGYTSATAAQRYWQDGTAYDPTKHGGHQRTLMTAAA